MLRKALQAVIASLRDDLFRARIPGDGLAVVEHLVAGLDQQQVALRRDALGIEVLPFTQISFGQLVRLTGVEILLRTEVAAKSRVRVDGGIDQHGFRIMSLREVSGIEATQRRSDEAYRCAAMGLQDNFRLGDCPAGKGRQRRTQIVGAQAELMHIAPQHLCLVRLRGGIEPMKIDDHAAAPCPSLASSFSWMPPKPPFDMTRTWSPAR